MPRMSRFGIRRRLKGAVKKAMGIDDASPAPSPAAAAPTPPPPRAPEPPAAAEPPPAPKTSAPPSLRSVAKPPPPPSAGAPAGSAAAEILTAGRMWVQAAGVRPDEVVPGAVHQVSVFGTRYALYKTGDGDFFATADACPHAGGPLGEGDLDGFEVTCPFHAYTFDIRDGSCTSGADLSVRCVETKVDGDHVLLEVPS